MKRGNAYFVKTAASDINLFLHLNKGTNLISFNFINYFLPKFIFEGAHGYPVSSKQFFPLVTQSFAGNIQWKIADAILGSDSFPVIENSPFWKVIICGCYQL